MSSRADNSSQAPRGPAGRGGAPKQGSWGGNRGPRGGSTPKVSYTSAAPSTSGAAPSSSNQRGRGGNQPAGRGRGGASRGSSAVQAHGAVLHPHAESLRLVDIGANLCHRDFKGDLTEVINRAKERKITPIIVTGTSVRSSEQAIELCQAHPGTLYSTVGVHPHDAKSCNGTTIPRLRELAQNPCVVSLGECGLDFDRNFSDPQVQELWFSEQLKLAAELKMPVFLHERSAHERFVAILEQHKDIIDLSTCVVHCFTGTAAEVKKYLDMGMYIGITGWVTNKDKGTDLRKAVKSIPLDRIMIETDAPFIAPRNAVAEDGSRVRINRNEPELLQLVLDGLAECMDVSVEVLAQKSTENAHRFFRIPLPETETE